MDFGLLSVYYHHFQYSYVAIAVIKTIHNPCWCERACSFPHIKDVNWFVSY